MNCDAECCCIHGRIAVMIDVVWTERSVAGLTALFVWFVAWRALS